MKDPSYSVFDLLAVVTFLIVQNGSTTTLDIKRELRARHHVAYQQDISENMIWLTDSLADTFTFEDVTDDRPYRIYKFLTNEPKAQPNKVAQLFGAILGK